MTVSTSVVQTVESAVPLEAGASEEEDGATEVTTGIELDVSLEKAANADDANKTGTTNSFIL